MIQLTTNKKELPTPYILDEKLFTWLIVPGDKLSPVTIGCPHDGMQSGDLSWLFAARTKGSTMADSLVWPIVKNTAWHVPVNIVRGLLPRFMLDYNRYVSKESYLAYAGDLSEDTEVACEDQQLIRYHEAYHDTLVATALKAKELYGSKAVFLDFHGFAKQPPQGTFDLILGTANTHTVVNGADKKFADFFRAKGYAVYLPEYIEYPIANSQREKFDGGFSPRNVFLKTGVDSMQIEICSEIRKDKDRSEKLAADMGEFIESIS